MHAVGTLSSFMRFFVVLQAFSNWRRIQSSLFSTGSCRQIFLTIFGIGLFMCFQGFATCCIFLLILLVFLALNFRHKNSSVLFFVLHRLFIHSRLLILFLEFRTHLNFLHENSLELSSRLHSLSTHIIRFRLSPALPQCCILLHSKLAISHTVSSHC